MDKARMIDPPDWMTDDRTQRVMRAIGGFESPAQAMFVGGCVRNVLIGRAVSDIDIATVHYPEDVVRKLEQAGIKSVPTGIDHGTITAVLEGKSFEITTLRRDVDTDGRHAVVAFTDDWLEDARRRDFTMNTLLATPDGAVFDPTGEGIADLDARRVRFVGDAPARIAEDYLRILRFFRFHAQYGGGAADPRALEACAAGAEHILMLSRERITQEFLKILAVPDPAPVLSMMFAHGVLEQMGMQYDESLMAHLCVNQMRYDCPDIMARLFVLGGMTGQVFEAFLSLSNQQKKTLAALSQGTAQMETPSRKSLRALIYNIGNAAAVQVYFIRLAQRDDGPDLDLLDIVRYWQAPVFPVNGQDMIAAGYEPGPEMGAVLATLEEGWIKKDFPDAAVKIPRKR